MTVTQLSTFVLVARLGSVGAAARALNVSESAVSQALTALRTHFGDPLIRRTGGGMRLTPAGARLLPVASRMVALSADAEVAVRAVRGAPDELRVIATSTLTEFVLPSLVEAFACRAGRRTETSFGAASGNEMRVLLENRLADVALGPDLGALRGSEVVSEPLFRTRLVVVTSARAPRPSGPPPLWSWLVDASGTDPDADSGRLLRRLGVTERHVRVFPNQTAAWAAAAEGAGVAPALTHLASPRIRRDELRVLDTPATPSDATWYATALRPEHRSPATDGFLHFLRTPAATRIMREPGTGVSPSQFRPPVHVTLWGG
ncbi:LysR family transcriptional regulator [Streptomyces pluripotens]|uniref:LysR family transcriptional regulator n=1 Tax=Streptomyces pluripotens TaxID=1355015 RepID=A0A221NS16_9ACTN|nr:MULTISPECIES: LysR family transcriptional regulator [Streptomyces]ASN22767.1 LysR family transcriptional regulator [Streptomyces pluripotens]KIE25437.1 LysR family transcriptional regulator [Streptomyces sp. MUSC 125]MCH0558153.1 LysR family transcriptional regulator [Streptomyces sp. MUM 16J]